MKRLLFPQTSYGVRPVSPEDAPDPVECPACGEDVTPGQACVECVSGVLAEPRMFPGRTAFPARRAA